MTPPAGTSQTPHSSEYISLRDYIDTRLVAEQRATEKAHETMERRLEGMNEFRSALKDQANQFVTRQEFNVTRQLLEDDVRFLRESRATLEGKASQSSLNVTLMISILGFLLGLTGLALKLFGAQ